MSVKRNTVKIGKVSPYLVSKRRKAAENVCWTVLLMMELGGLEIPLEWREYLAKPMQEWVELAHATGEIRK